MKIQGCLTNKSDNWNTPSQFYKDLIESNYYDPCPKEPKENGLNTTWKELTYVNPPYSQIEKWVDKAIKEREHCKLIIMLLPARTDTQWFKKIYENANIIEFITGRLHFNDSKLSAPFPSMIVYLENEKTEKVEISLINKKWVEK